MIDVFGAVPVVAAVDGAVHRPGHRRSDHLRPGRGAERHGHADARADDPDRPGYGRVDMFVDLALALFLLNLFTTLLIARYVRDKAESSDDAVRSSPC
jgi:hypothetical protein